MNESISKERLLAKDLYLNKFLKKKKPKKNEPKISDEKLIKLRDAIKNINFTDIILDEGELYHNEQSYNVKISNREITLLLEYAKNYARINRISDETVNPNKFDFEISVGLNEFNRVHFNKSLPNILRGVGLGYKIYKALAFKLGYLSSDNTASFSAQSVWYYLIQDPDFNYILCKNFVFIIKRNLPTDQKINIVLDYIKNYDWLFEDESEFDIDDELVKELRKYGNT